MPKESKLRMFKFVRGNLALINFQNSRYNNFQSAATELAIRLVESVGQKRQDTVFDLSCESVNQVTYLLLLFLIRYFCFTTSSH